MTEALPPGYWDDVNRYCGELLAMAPHEKAGIWMVSAVTRKVSWQAMSSPTTTATLEKGVIRYVGGLRKTTYHVLRLLTPAPEIGQETEYGITFDPKRQVIEKATAQLVFRPSLGEASSLADAADRLGKLIEYKNAYVRENEELAALGADIPGPADYELLLDELRNGTEQRLI